MLWLGIFLLASVLTTWIVIAAAINSSRISARSNGFPAQTKVHFYPVKRGYPHDSQINDGLVP